MNGKKRYSRITRLPQVSAEAGGCVRGVPSPVRATRLLSEGSSALSSRGQPRVLAL